MQARKRSAPRTLKEEVDLPREVETSTPVEGRSVRSRPRVSYAEVPDTNAFDMSTGDEESPFERRLFKKQPPEVSKKRFEVDLRERLDECTAGSRSPRRFILGSSLRRRDLESSSTSSGASSRVKVTEGKQNLSQEIVDLSQADSTQDVESEDEDVFESPPRPSHPLPPKSPGKYQSSVTPGRGIKLIINRIKKPGQLELELSPPKPLIMPRLSRGVCKEMGISPNKLQSIIAQSPPPKPKPHQSSTTPEKENRPRTPKLLLKRMPSSSMANSPLASKWKAETKHSPVKAAGTAGLQSPGKLAFSPLSARSIHKLSTSPIINTHGEGRRPKKKVNKQLAYNA